MAKGQNIKRGEKKKAMKTLKEKREDKKLKKTNKKLD